MSYFTKLKYVVIPRLYGESMYMNKLMKYKTREQRGQHYYFIAPFLSLLMQDENEEPRNLLVNAKCGTNRIPRSFFPLRSPHHLRSYA